MEVGWSEEGDRGGEVLKIMGPKKKDVKTFSKNAFEFGEATIVHGNKGAEFGVIIGLGIPDGMRIEGMENVFGYEG